METDPLVFHIPHLPQEIPSCEMDQFLMPPLELKQAIEDFHTPPEIVESLQKEAREQEISCVMIELRRDSLDLMNVERLLEVIK